MLVEDSRGALCHQTMNPGPMGCSQETTVAADDGGDGDIRFMLPGSPSPTLLVALVAASRELDRAGTFPFTGSIPETFELVRLDVASCDAVCLKHHTDQDVVSRRGAWRRHAHGRYPQVASE